jgi:RND family efflux transporter MFP subunit
MSFGSPTPIDVSVSGPNLADNRAYAEKLRRELAGIEALRDLQYAQSLDYPTIEVQVDREKAGLSGVVPAEIAKSIVAATSSSRFVVPNYWPDSKTGIGYQVQVQIPQSQTKSLQDLEMVPLKLAGGRELLLADVAKVTSGTMPGQFDRYNMRRQISLTANIHGQDLGAMSREVSQAIARAGAPPQGANLDIRGQIPPMQQLFQGLGVGLALAVVVIFLLLAANFQSLRLALVTVSTVPAVIAGVALMLLITRTTINIQSFIGSIMAVGVAMANGILLVTFAEERRRQGAAAVEAAVEGARRRVRPILMTSMAMIAGMTPLALAVGESGEQSAPLGRAVIGGLLAATFATLFVLPSVFALVQRRAKTRSASLDPEDPQSIYYMPGSVMPGSTAGLTGSACLLLTVALAGLATIGCRAKDSPQPSAAAKSEAAPLRVNVVKPQRKAMRRTLTQPAQIEPFEQARLYAKIPAYVTEYHADIGDAVRRGQVLVKLSAPEVERELEQTRALVSQAAAELEQSQAAVKVVQADAASAEAAVKEATAAVKRHEAESERWNSEYERVVKLVSRSAVTQKLADETKAQLLAAQAAQAQAEATIERAKSDLAASHAHVEKARADEVAARARREVAEANEARAAAMVDYLTIKAPFDGTIADRHADVGFYAQPPGGSASLPLFNLVSTNPLRVFVDVPEPDAPLVDEGDAAAIHVQALAGQDFRGSVTRTSWALDPGTRTLRVEVDVANPQGKLRPGMYAKVTLELAHHDAALVVPAATVTMHENLPCVFVAHEGKAVRKRVVPGIANGDEVEIVSGLAGDEAVISAKGASIADGQAIEPAAAVSAK